MCISRCCHSQAAKGMGAPSGAFRGGFFREMACFMAAKGTKWPLYAFRGRKTRKKAEIKKLSHTEFRPIYDAFDVLDFTNIYKESGDLVGYDGWTLKCTISNIMSEISVKLWCPSESPEKPETTKLLQACEKVFSLFEENQEK